jgi:hypothetical protein
MKFTSVNDPVRIHATFDEFDGLCIVISSPTAPTIGSLILLGSIACAGTCTCLVFLAYRVLAIALLRDPAAFVIHPGTGLVMVVTVASSLWFAYNYFFELPRREVIQIDGDNLKVASFPHLFPRRTRVYPLRYVSNLRYSPSFPNGRATDASSSLSIALDYEGSTAYFGRGLPEKEVRRIIKTIKDRYKITDDKDEALPVEHL